MMDATIIVAAIALLGHILWAIIFYLFKEKMKMFVTKDQLVEGKIPTARLEEQMDALADKMDAFDKKLLSICESLSIKYVPRELCKVLREKFQESGKS